MSHKEIAIAFQHLVSEGKVNQAFKKYVSTDFSHHNPYSKGDRESLLLGMEENAKEFPDKVFEIKRVLEDGDLIAIHARLKLSADMPEMATVHIFRFEGDMIIELWDVAQQSPTISLNMNGMI